MFKILKDEIPDIEQAKKDMKAYNENLVIKRKEYNTKYQERLSLLKQGHDNQDLLKYLIDNKQYAYENNYEPLEKLIGSSFKIQTEFQIEKDENTKIISNFLYGIIDPSFPFCMLTIYAFLIGFVMVSLSAHSLLCSFLSIFLLFSTLIFSTYAAFKTISFDKSKEIQQYIEAFYFTGLELKKKETEASYITNSDLFFSDITKDKEYV